MRPDGRNILLSSDGSLILNNVKPSDQGTYTCNAYTGIYSVSATAEVKVVKETQQGENAKSAQTCTCYLHCRGNVEKLNLELIYLFSTISSCIIIIIIFFLSLSLNNDFVLTL